MCKIGVYKVSLVIIYLKMCIWSWFGDYLFKNDHFIFNKYVNLRVCNFIVCLKCAKRLIKYLSS